MQGKNLGETEPSYLRDSKCLTCLKAEVLRDGVGLGDLNKSLEC